MASKLQEKRSLVRMAQALGQVPDPQLLEDIERLERIETRIKRNIASDLNEIFSQQVKDEQLVDAVIEDIQQIEAPLKYELDEGPLTDQQIQTMQTLANEEINDVASKVAHSISRQVASEGTLVRPDAEMPAATAALEQKVKYLENWVSRIAATGAGSGEVNFRWLDDVDRASINKDWYLTYNPTIKKFQFVDTRVSIETFDRSSSIALTATPVLLRPASTINSKNLTYDSSTGIFTFLTDCEVSLAITLNVIADASGQRLYQYAETNTGSGWAPFANSGKVSSLTNNQLTQIVNAQSASRTVGQQIRYYLWSSSPDKVRLVTETLPNVSGATVFVPAIRIQYAGR
jgi:hypothetical protein